MSAMFLVPFSALAGGEPKKTSIGQLYEALAGGRKSLSIRFIGDSITWGANASGTLPFISGRKDPRRRTITDRRAPLDAPSYVNLFRDWIQKHFYPDSTRVDVRGGRLYQDGS